MNDDTKQFFERLAGVGNDWEGEIKPHLVDNGKMTREENIFDEEEGQLAIDVYQDNNNIVIEAPVAGVSIDDLDVDITSESVAIKGKRERYGREEKRDYFVQECYWGKFSRSVILPEEIDTDRATASLKNGILKIILPKTDKKKTKKIKIKFE